MTGSLRSGTVIWGIILVVVGLLLLAQTLGFAPNIGAGAAGVVFGVGGIALIAWYLTDRRRWWALIAGPTLVALAMVVLMQTVVKAPDDWTGAVFLGGAGIGFLLVAVTSQARWWAFLPAGTLITLTVVTVAGSRLSSAETGAIFFFGLAATFGILVVMPRTGGSRQWAMYPAGVMLVIGLLALLSDAAAGVAWPLMLVAIGAVLLFRAARRPGRLS